MKTGRYGSKHGNRAKAVGTIVISLLLGLALGAAAQQGPGVQADTSLKPAGLDNPQAPQPFTDVSASGPDTATMSVDQGGQTQQTVAVGVANPVELSNMLNDMSNPNSGRNPLTVSINGGIATVQQTVGQMPGENQTENAVQPNTAQSPNQPQTTIPAADILTTPIAVQEVAWGGQPAAGDYQKSWISVLNWGDQKYQYHAQTRTNPDGTPQVVTQPDGVECQVVDVMSNIVSDAEPGEKLKMSGVTLYVSPDQGIVKINVEILDPVTKAPSAKIFEGSQLQVKIIEGKDAKTKEVQVYNTPDQLGNRVQSTLTEHNFHQDPGIGYN